MTKDCIPSAKKDSSDTVVVYGIGKLHRAERLLRSLAEIPCYPSTIFKIDVAGTLFGALDQLRKPARVYYIKILNWCDRKKTPPVISWTIRPDDFTPTLHKRGPEALIRYASALRDKRPMTLEMSVESHAKLYAKTARGAS